MVLDRALARDGEKFLRHEQRDEGHDLQVGLERLELLPHLRLAVGRRLIDREFGGKRRFLQRFRLGAFLLRRDVNADHVLAALDQRLQHGLAERLLAVNDDTHEAPRTLVFCSLSCPAKAGHPAIHLALDRPPSRAMTAE